MSGETGTGELVVGPLLRHVDETSATLWVEVDRTATVSVEADGRRWSAPTFAVHGHHYAVVAVDGLGPGETHPYVLRVDDRQVWPEPASAYPSVVLRTHDHDAPLRIAFGSCRVSVPHDAEHHASFGVDALRTYGMHLAAHPDASDGPREGAPDLLLFLGDQVYADETSEAMRDFIAARRDPEQAPWWELKDYEEYADSTAWPGPTRPRVGCSRRSPRR